MSEYREHEEQKIDLLDLMQDAIQGFRKLWWLIIGLVLIFALKSYFTVKVSYQPQYIASATMAVRCVGNDAEYVNAETAEQMAEVFPYILRSGVLQKAIAEEMGLESMPGSISMTAEEGTNLFTVSANAGEAQLSYDLLQATLNEYPKVAKFVIGEIEMDILDETGVPTDSGREQVIRGSFVDGATQGGLIGIVILAFYAITRRTVKSRKELRNVVNLEDFGSIPYVPMKKRKKMGRNNAVNLKDERVSQFYLEAIRKLRIKVAKEMEKNGYRSLLVTSSIPGEGKTTLASNLAIALAKQGKKVILVDCDPRNPSVAEIMGAPSKYPGLGAVLRGEIAIEEALVEEEVNGGSLRILYGGEPDTSTAKLLGTDMMQKLIEVLEKRADIVILDTAPSELLADTTVLAQFVDAALYVVKCDYAKKGRIRNGVQALSMSGIKIMGYVFNEDKSRRSSGYGYGYGYKNYGGYYGYYGKRSRDDESGRVIKD